MSTATDSRARRTAEADRTEGPAPGSEETSRGRSPRTGQLGAGGAGVSPGTGGSRPPTRRYAVGLLGLLVPVLVPNGWVIGAAFAVVGFTNVVGNVITRSMRQRLIPDRLLGRVGGVPARLAAGNATRNPRRTAATATALLIGVTLTTSMVVGAASTRAPALVASAAVPSPEPSSTTTTSTTAASTRWVANAR